MSENYGESGFPNLPLWSKYSNPDLTYPTLQAGVWIEVAPADPSRWVIDFSDFLNRGFTVTIDPDTLLLRGWIIPNNGSKRFDRDKYLFAVQSAWYATATAAPFEIQVYTCQIRLKG